MSPIPTAAALVGSRLPLISGDLGTEMFFKKKDKLSSEQKGLRYIVGVVTLVLIWKYRATLAGFIDLPLFMLFDQEPPQQNITSVLLMVGEAIVFYTGAIVVSLVTGLHKVLGYLTEGVWEYAQEKADDGNPEVDTTSEKIIDAINQIGGYVNGLLDRVENLEEDFEIANYEFEEVDDE